MSSEGGYLSTREVGPARSNRINVEEGDGMATELPCQKPCVTR